MKVLNKSFFITPIIKLIKYPALSVVFNSIRWAIPSFIHLKVLEFLHSSEENFLKINIGHGNISSPGYINIPIEKFKTKSYVCTNLPFSDNSIELIETYNLLQFLLSTKFHKVLKEWWRVLIPGGRLIIEYSDIDNEVEENSEIHEKRFGNIFGLSKNKEAVQKRKYSFSELKKILEKCGFRGDTTNVPQEGLEIPKKIEIYKSIPDKNVRLPDQEWFEKEAKRPEKLTIEWQKKNINAKIIEELGKDFFSEKIIISLGCGTGDLGIDLEKKDFSIVGVNSTNGGICDTSQYRKNGPFHNSKCVNASIRNMPFFDNSIDVVCAVEFLEYIEPDQMEKVFLEIRRILKPDKKIFITVPYRNAYVNSSQRQFFTKGILAELFDKLNIHIDWIELDERRARSRKYKLLKTMLINRPSFQRLQQKKICAVGAYEHFQYNQLGFHWDGQVRAFRELGYEALLLDVRKDKNYENLRSKILDFKPDILWLGLEDCLPFIKWMSEDVKSLRKKGCIVLYWFCDIREPKLTDFSKLIDIMFISNAGQIKEYKKAYNIDKVHFMPQACTPTFMYDLNLNKEYEIGFAGSSFYRLHTGRKKLLNKLKKESKIVIRNKVRNNIANFYSKCKIILGINSDIVTYLYTSNRFFVAIGCGAFYLCEWFPGIEELAKNHFHVVWFKTEEELFSLVDYYLKHDKEREFIQKNAQELAHSKHTYTHRIQNIFDIIEGKANDFSGFIYD